MSFLVAFTLAWSLTARSYHRACPDWRHASPAMQGALEGAYPARHRRVHVGERGRDDPRGECGGIQLVLGVQDEARVEGLGRHLARLRAREHVEEVGGERQ